MNRVVTLEQPVVCPLATERAASEEKIQVRFLKNHPQQLWVAENNVPWLIGYMATEYGLGGVDEDPEKPRADEGGDGAEAEEEDGAAVAAPAITWDWESNDGYIAVLNGKQVRCQVSTFSKAKWDKMCAIHNYNTTFSQASPEEISTACHDFLKDYLEKAKE